MENYENLEFCLKIIVKKEKINQIETTTELVNTIYHLVSDQKRNQFLSQVFQSIRIEVNNEIESLKQMLHDGWFVKYKRKVCCYILSFFRR